MEDAKTTIQLVEFNEEPIQDSVTGKYTGIDLKILVKSTKEQTLQVRSPFSWGPYIRFLAPSQTPQRYLPPSQTENFRKDEEKEFTFILIPLPGPDYPKEELSIFLEQQPDVKIEQSLSIEILTVDDPSISVKFTPAEVSSKVERGVFIKDSRLIIGPYLFSDFVSLNQ